MSRSGPLGRQTSQPFLLRSEEPLGRGLQMSLGGLEDASPPRMGVHFDLEYFPGRATAVNLLGESG